MAGRIVLEFKNDLLTLSRREYGPFLAELKELHNFPDNAWTSIPPPFLEERAAFTRLLESLPPKFSDDSMQHEVSHAEDLLNTSFRNGMLLWPEGPAAREVKTAKQRAPESALTALLRALLEVRKTVPARSEDTLVRSASAAAPLVGL